MNEAARKLRDFFVSLKLTVVLIALGMVLIFAATLSQATVRNPPSPRPPCFLAGGFFPTGLTGRSPGRRARSPEPGREMP